MEAVCDDPQVRGCERQLRIGISGKVVFAMVTVVISIMLLVGYYSFHQSKNLLLSQFEKELRLESKNIVMEITSIFVQEGEVVRQLSSNPIIKEFLALNVSRKRISAHESYEWIPSYAY